MQPKPRNLQTTLPIKEQGFTLQQGKQWNNTKTIGVYNVMDVVCGAAAAPRGAVHCACVCAHACHHLVGFLINFIPEGERGAGLIEILRRFA